MTWVDVPDDSPFPLDNLPYGVFVRGDERPRVGVAVGDRVVDLGALAAADRLPGDGWWDQPSLNAFMATGATTWRRVREALTELLTAERHQDQVRQAMVRQDDVRMLLPFAVADLVDFYASLPHATNLGRILRGDAEPPASWRHLPVGYHGRSGTVVVSGTPVVRPCGQRRDGNRVVFGPTQQLDFEAEVGFVVGVPSTAGRPVTTGGFADHVFGVVLVNDWSARDVQAWEYQPLGPFLGKSFLTSVSPWVVPLDALAAARVTAPEQQPAPLPHLRDTEPWGLDLALEVRLGESVVSRPSYAGMYWTPAQMLAHLTSNGATVRTGDLYASGTVSGPEPAQWGSLMELSQGGTTPVKVGARGRRTFLQDGDTVTISATAPAAGGGRIGLGEVTGTVLAARPK